MLKEGIKNSIERIVTEDMTAKAVGSGTLKVFATPCMIAMMEEASHTSVREYLADGEGTVGISIEARHLVATPVGMKVVCESELTEVDEKRLVFRVRVFDEEGLVGEGTHERFIINDEKFMQKAHAKLERSKK